MADIRRLVDAAFVPALASELGAQIDAGTGTRSRLAELGMPIPLADEVAAQVGTAGNARRLIELGMVADVAQQLVAAIVGGRGTSSSVPFFGSNSPSWGENTTPLFGKAA